jgi:hypothetical protein
METLYRPLFCRKTILGNEATNAVSGTHNSRPVEEQSAEHRLFGSWDPLKLTRLVFVFVAKRCLLPG